MLCSLKYKEVKVNPLCIVDHHIKTLINDFLINLVLRDLVKFNFLELINRLNNPCLIIKTCLCLF